MLELPYVGKIPISAQLRRIQQPVHPFTCQATRTHHTIHVETIFFSLGVLFDCNLSFFFDMFFKLLSLLQSSSIVFFGQLVTYTFALGIKEIEYIYDAI